MAFQPHIDASSSQLVFGKSVQIPGSLMGEPGPPLTTEQTRQLLGQLYKQADTAPVAMSGKHEAKDISFTDKVTHVYVKNHGDEKSLSPKFQGPWEIVSRPSRSMVQVRVGYYASGQPRLQNFSWSSCKPAYFRDEPFEVAKKSLCRPPSADSSGIHPSVTVELQNNTDVTQNNRSSVAQNPVSQNSSTGGVPAKFQKPFFVQMPNGDSAR